MMMKRGEIRLGTKLETILQKLYYHKWMTAKSLGRFSGLEFTDSAIGVLYNRNMIAKFGEAYKITRMGVDYLEKHKLVHPIHITPPKITRNEP